jgi:hypothetical protein
VAIVAALLLAIVIVSGVIGDDDDACTKFSVENCRESPFDER